LPVASITTKQTIGQEPRVNQLTVGPMGPKLTKHDAAALSPSLQLHTHLCQLYHYRARKCTQTKHGCLGIFDHKLVDPPQDISIHIIYVYYIYRSKKDRAS
jgi:hypothetical protein